MTKPNFAEMTYSELHAYVSKHRNDDEAFYALVDRVHTQGTKVQSDEHFIELVQAKIKAREEKAE
jgi:hypothetical protein